MRVQVYLKKNGLSDIEVNDQIIAVNISEPDLFIKNLLNNRG